jgi:MoCo/4Fe-4S cofactor protein with predicted Tat translocation signal
MTERRNGHNKLDLVTIRTRLEGARDKQLWQSLQQLAETQEYKDFLHHEFPYDPEKTGSGISRRDMLKLMGASAALAGLTACTKLPTEKIVPYVQAPEEFIPGKPLFYATSMPFGGVANGLLVESHMGRPTKVEGSTQHPGSLGAADIFAQASTLTLYDPDRSQVVVHNGRIENWSEFLNAMSELRPALLATQGRALRILTETVTSATLAAQLAGLLKQFPKAQWHQYEPAGRDNARAGARLAFGEYVEPQYRFDRADVILSLDSDFLFAGSGSVRYAHDFADKRRLTGPASAMNRLYVIEPTPSITGAQADHRLPLRAGDVEGFTRWLAVKLGVKAAADSGPAPAAYGWIEALARDLQTHRGSSVVLAGDVQPPAVHALAHAINFALENVGKTVVYTDPIEANPTDQMQSLQALVADMRNGQVETLVILSANPVYTAPADLEFKENLLKVSQRIHLGLYEDETAEQCHWHIPEAHFLESWGDARAYDGTVSTIQPLIAPLYDGKSAHELLAVLLGQPGRTSHDVVREYWKGQRSEKDFEAFWETTLHDGVMAGTAFPPKPVTLKMELGSVPAPTPPNGGLEIVFRPDPTIWDGRFSNNGWLQECPKPLTKLTWDNVAMVSPATAQALRVENEDLVELRYRGRTVRAPIWIMPGHADQSVTVRLGYGRPRAGKVGSGAGFNAYELRTSDQPGFDAGLEIRKTGQRYALAATQHHHIISQEGKEVEEESVTAERRELLRVAKLEDFRKNPDFAKDPADETTRAESLYPAYDYSQGYQWGMAIDLNSCIGCNACVVACQAENNIAVVGKDQVSRGREMHWIRVDTYYEGGLDNPRMYNEIVPCMQCENAPCEVVCPVGATVHSPEGLNEMIYNRCVGTRYCSNNCPYKVRRFNFFLYSDWTTPSLYGLRNPNVTVRSRGVMEKCTYCIQRINAVKIKAEEQDRAIKDGEILTACQQTCPAQAIVFGNINDPGSQVSKLKAQSRNYSLLAELNARPRTTYLAKVRNPNPEIPESKD